MHTLNNIDTGGRDSKEMHYALQNADIVLIPNKTNQNIILMDSILYDREAIRRATSEGIGITQTQSNKAKRDFSLFFDELLTKYNA